MHHVGTPLPRAPPQQAVRRQAESKGPVDGYRHAGHRDLVRLVDRRFPGLARTDELDEVVAFKQPADGARGGQCATVDFGWPGFGDVGNEHVGARIGARTDPGGRPSTDQSRQTSYLRQQPPAIRKISRSRSGSFVWPSATINRMRALMPLR